MEYTVECLDYALTLVLAGLVALLLAAAVGCLFISLEHIFPDSLFLIGG